MNNFNTITIILDEVSLINERLKAIAENVGNIVSSTKGNPKVECVLTFPQGIKELNWMDIGKYYHRQSNGDVMNFRAYMTHDHGGFHEELCSGFENEPLLIILFKEPIWYDYDLFKTDKPNYVLFNNDDENGGMYPCGVAYYFSKDDI